VWIFCISFTVDLYRKRTAKPLKSQLAVARRDSGVPTRGVGGRFVHEKMRRF
jgi:hypothetical protein